MISQLSIFAIRLLLGLLFITNTIALTIFTAVTSTKLKSEKSNLAVVILLTVNILVNAILFYLLR